MYVVVSSNWNRSQKARVNSHCSSCYPLGWSQYTLKSGYSLKFFFCFFTKVLKMKESSKDFLWLLTLKISCGCPVPHPSFINAIFVWRDDPLPCIELFHYLLIFFPHILCLFLLFPSFTLLVFSYPVYIGFLYPRLTY